VPLLADPDVPRPEQNRVAERSLIGLLQMLIEITINATLNPWRKHPAILARMPDFEIKLGFGLHMGWAVEGALDRAEDRCLLFGRARQPFHVSGGTHEGVRSAAAYEW
jgi:hypothetical protein